MNKPKALTSSNRSSLRTLLRPREWVVVALTCAALLAGELQRGRVLPAADAGPYLASVVDAYAKMPKSLTLSGSTLVSSEIPVPTAATQVLKPNVIDSRAWSDLTTGENFSVLFVHCGDTRDMLAHYPANCYVGSGFRIVTQSPLTVQADGLELRGTEYLFAPQRFDGPANFRVFNVMMLADNNQVPDMAGLYRSVRLYGTASYGAGQIQVIVPDAMSAKDRAMTYERAIELYAPLIRTVLASSSSLTTVTSSTP